MVEQFLPAIFVASIETREQFTIRHPGWAVNRGIEPCERFLLGMRDHDRTTDRIWDALQRVFRVDRDDRQAG